MVLFYAKELQMAHADSVQQLFLIPTEPIVEGLEEAQQQFKDALQISPIFDLCCQLYSCHLCFWQSTLMFLSNFRI